MKVCITIVLLLIVTDAQAYLDPGTGSMLLQVILGGVAAVGVVIKLYWHKLRVAIGLARKSDPEDETDLKDEIDLKDGADPKNESS